MNRSYKRILSLAGLGAGVLFCILAFYSPESVFENTSDSGELVIYSSERAELMEAVIPLFEEKYDISVHLVYGESKELLDRISREGGKTDADVIMGVSLLELSGHETLFGDYVSVNDKYLMDNCRNTYGYATSYVVNANCFIVNKTLGREVLLTGYKDLVNQDLKGRIIMADPEASTTGFSQLLNILEVYGGCEAFQAWEFVEELLDETDITMIHSSKEVYSGVAKGEYLVGLAQEDVCAGLLRQGADIRVVYPEEGSLYWPKSAAILKSSRRLEYAKYFVDFLISKDMQDIFGTLLTSRPVRQDAKLSQFLLDTSEVSMITQDEERLRLQKEQILEQFSRLRKEISEHN